MWKWLKKVLNALAYKPEPIKKPEIEMKIESCTIEATNRKLDRPWTVEIRHGWPVYKFMGEGAWAERYDDRYWKRNVDGDPINHHLIGETGLVEGMEVIWKGSPFDYIWNEGVIRKRDSNWYVESPTDSKHWGNPTFNVEQNCWVTNGACYIPNMPVFT